MGTEQAPYGGGDGRLMRCILVFFLAASFVAAQAPAASAGSKKRARKKRPKKKANMPRNWTWPPSAPMKELGAQCKRDLSASGVAWKRGPKRRKIATPVVVPSMNFAGLKVTPQFRKPPFVMDCQLAMAFARAAPAVLAQGVSELRFSTIHEYRRIRLRGRTLKALSRHSLGLAADIYELVTKDGEKIIIKKHYRDSEQAKAVEKALLATGALRALLTPGNDPRSHGDHFHVEARMKIPRR